MTTPDAGATAFFSADHRACDDSWASLEESAAQSDAAVSRASWERFDRGMRRHFAMEEEVLFPAIEQATGMFNTGPVAVMRHEHTQMRALLDEMGQRAKAGDFEGLLDQGDTLHLLIQQHNAKEEGILYPLADRALKAGWAELAAKLKAY